jgi:hypothetical protein
MNPKWARLTVLCFGLAVLAIMPSSDAAVQAQENNRTDDAVVKLAGRKVRIDKTTGKLRDLSAQEARDLVSTLTSMTTRTDSDATAASGATLVRMDGFDHVLVGRPNEDGTIDVQCVSTVDEAVSFLSQTPKSDGKE